MKNNLTDLEIEMFHQLKKEWLDATSFHSSPTIINAHPAIESIVAMGEKVLPLIFEDMGKKPCWEKREGYAHWYQTVRAITGVNIEIPDDMRGRIREMNQYYIRWGKDNGYV